MKSERDKRDKFTLGNELICDTIDTESRVRNVNAFVESPTTFVKSPFKESL